MTWLIIIVVFLLTIGLIHMLSTSINRVKGASGNWVYHPSGLFYWQAVLFTSAGITVSILFLLKYFSLMPI